MSLFFPHLSHCIFCGFRRILIKILTYFWPELVHRVVIVWKLTVKLNKKGCDKICEITCNLLRFRAPHGLFRVREKLFNGWLCDYAENCKCDTIFLDFFLWILKILFIWGYRNWLNYVYRNFASLGVCRVCFFLVCLPEEGCLVECKNARGRKSLWNVMLHCQRTWHYIYTANDENSFLCDWQKAELARRWGGKFILFLFSRPWGVHGA